MKVMIRMRHGLGDNAQFTIVLKHIKHYHPNWVIDLEVGIGKQSYYNGLVNNIFDRNQEYDTRQYDEILEVLWPPPSTNFDNLPSTKPTQFLCYVLGVKPIEKLYRKYEVKITKEDDIRTQEYKKKLPSNRGFVLVHYLAKTLKHNKSLEHSIAKRICDKISSLDYTPVILDWKNESFLPDNKIIFNPDVSDPVWGNKYEVIKDKSYSLADAGTIASLIKKASLYVGIDSGPMHVAGCTNTPTIGIWHGHHPVNFYDLPSNVTHLVPKKKKLSIIYGREKYKALEYFERSYKYEYYDNLEKHLDEIIEKKLR
jgi:ADP-heptose:LPS heptosyltransferase